MSHLIYKTKREALIKEKRLAKQKRRQIGIRLKFVNFLIVCEGERTEPNYFKALLDHRASEVRTCQIEGTGSSTCRLVEAARTIIAESPKKFDRVWLVFDKDDFTDFNEAVRLADKHGYSCAWSNEAFELWYCLHFSYIDSQISRHQYIDIIERNIRKKSNNPKYTYQKNDSLIYNILQKYGDEKLACRYAQKLRKKFIDADYASHKPCTRVDLLVYELHHPEELLNK